MKSIYDWQIECMEAVGMQEFGGPPVAVVAANGSGKTSNLVSPLVMWFLSKYPRGQVIITSGSFRQIEKQLWPAMRIYKRKFLGWDFLQTEIKTPEYGFALGFSTDDAGRAEGWHPKISNTEDPVFIIVDEPKTVPDAIFEAFDRCTRVFQLWVSSPGAPRGQFYDALHANRKHHWVRKVTSMECPHIDPAKRARDLEKYGADHPLYRSMHDAEFTEDIDRMILTSENLAKAIEFQPKCDEEGETVAFCDFAAGRDENVLAIRKGNHARIVKAWVEKDTMQAAREFVYQFKLNGLQPGQVWGDADGLGTAMIDAIEELGFFMNRFHGGQAASDTDEYANLIGEVWHVGAREIERGRIHLGQLDPVTFKQLTARKSEWSDNGKLRCESKEKMAKEGIKSPDRADALLGCIGCGSRLSGAIAAKNLAIHPSDSRGFGSPLVEGF
jgi:phage terminase large subunit